MAINIFGRDGDESSKKRSKFADDVVGRFRSGHQLNRRPVALSEWRVTTGDPEVADSVRRLLGGDKPAKWETQGEDNLEVFTDAQQVDIIIDGPSSVRSSMVLWGRNGKLIRACDGVQQKDDAKSDCACPQTLAELKAESKDGTACEPSIQIVFALADDPDLGLFRFQSGSWSLAEDINTVEKKLAEIDGPAAATLALEVVEFTTKAGEHRKFTKPVVKVIGPAA